MVRAFKSGCPPAAAAEPRGSRLRGLTGACIESRHTSLACRPDSRAPWASTPASALAPLGQEALDLGARERDVVGERRSLVAVHRVVDAWHRDGGQRGGLACKGCGGRRGLLSSNAPNPGHDT